MIPNDAAEGKDTTKRTGNETMKVSDLAAIAGVSPSTVSKVINGRAGIADDTRRRVEKVMAQYGYFKPLVSTKLSQTIELVIDDVAYNGSVDLIKHASYWAQQVDFALTVTQTDGGKETGHCLRGILDRNPMGVIVRQPIPMTSAEKNLLESRNIPLVIIDPFLPADDDAMWISTDKWTGGFQIAQMLISMGHTRIGIINGEEEAQSTIAQYGGFLAATHHAGIAPMGELVKTNVISLQDGYRAAKELLDLDEPPTAIVADSDQIAVSVYRAAQERGIAIPDQLSVIGFDNVYPSEYLAPPLTTVDQSFNTIARKAIEMIIDTRRDRPVERHIVLPVKTVKRDSVAKPHQP